MGVNNWPILIKTIKDLHIEHCNQNGKINFDYSSNDRDLDINELIACV
jgi:hypothetical protein